ncbi:hypothetical protein M3570_22315, partial [Bacillus subtilis]|nr:hypothetical protein [Bacillus subtilis]
MTLKLMICRLSTTCREQKAKQRSSKRAGLHSSAVCRGATVKGSEDERSAGKQAFERMGGGRGPRRAGCRGGARR